MSSCICTWLMPARLNSTGSSAVEMLSVGLVELGERRVERGGLARAGGPGDQHHAVGPVDRLLEAVELARARSRAWSCRAGGSTCRGDAARSSRRTASGRRETRKSISLPLADLELDASVLRQAALGDVELRHDLEARGDRVLQLQRRLHHLVEHAVDAVADAEAPSRTARCGCREAPFLIASSRMRLHELDDRRVARRASRGRRR